MKRRLPAGAGEQRAPEGIASAILPVCLGVLPAYAWTTVGPHVIPHATASRVTADTGSVHARVASAHAVGWGPAWPQRME